MTAKTYAERRVIIPWSKEDEALMRVTVASKLLYNPALTDMLLETGDQMIVEDVSGRPNDSGLFWGGYLTSQGLQGENKLGKIWVEVRELMDQARYHSRPYDQVLHWYINTVKNNTTLPVMLELYEHS